jgi:hypothetical protein
MSLTLTQGLAPIEGATRPSGRGLLEGLAVVLAFTAGHALAYPWLVRAWGWALQTGIDALSLNALLHQASVKMPWGLPALQRWSLVGPAASVGVWGWVLQVATLALGHVGLRRLSRHEPPVAKAGWWVLALYGASLVWWALWPQHAPQHLAEHTGDLFTFGVAWQAMVPLMLGVMHFPLESRLSWRMLGVGVVLGYFVVCLPFKLLAHAWLVGHLGGAALPVLALCFGPVLDVLIFVALLAWVGSWGNPPSLSKTH